MKQISWFGDPNIPVTTLILDLTLSHVTAIYDLRVFFFGSSSHAPNPNSINIKYQFLNNNS